MVQVASKEAFLQAVRSPFEEVCRGVTEAIHQAPTGPVIPAREEKVRDLFARFRPHASQTALPMKIAAAEAAFSPQHPETGKRLQNKGPEEYRVLTVHDRVVLRRRWYAPEVWPRPKYAGVASGLAWERTSGYTADLSAAAPRNPGHANS
jgi:hypothetical protein